jgi:hypothetical protein
MVLDAWRLCLAIIQLFYPAPRVAEITRMDAADVFTFTGAAALLLVSMTGANKGFRSLGDSVNAAVYLLLLYTVPALFRTPGDLKKLLKICVVLYVPAIIYMLVHFFRDGIFDWEMDYVKSGLTGEIRQLMERKFRPFGTMNSAANASTVFGLILALIVSGIWKYRSLPPYDRQTNPITRFLLIVPIVPTVRAVAGLLAARGPVRRHARGAHPGTSTE